MSQAHLSVQNLSSICQTNKGLGNYAQFHAGGWNIKNEDVSLPTACLVESKLARNIAWMAEFADKSRVKLAPHGKTSMVPALFKRQLQAGAYAITVATPAQARIAVKAGATRILMANQLVGKTNMAMIAELLKEHDVVFYCLVDSVDNVNALNAYFSHREQSLNVLIELGIEGGRAGAQEASISEQVIEAVKQSPALKLAGVELYEGVVAHFDQVAPFLRSAADLCIDLVAQNRFETEEVLLTAGGSAFYDVVCEVFNEAPLPPSVIPVIRPGCYIAHDTGIYEQAQQHVLARSQLACSLEGELSSALQIWAYVQSIPEAGKAIIAMGKRDVAYDAGLPTPVLHCSPSEERNLDTSLWRVERIMDQHAMMRFDSSQPLKIGDIIAFSSSHPCLTFDKWRYINVIDEHSRVIDVYSTYF